MTARDAAVYSLVVLALSAFAVFFALGGIVAHRPPTDIEYVVHNALYGKSVAVAVKLTTVGRFPAYLAASLLSIVIAFGWRRWLRDAVFAIASLLVAWQASDFFKVYFARIRPPRQLVFSESSYSYPSGHATLAIAFYGAWAFFIWRSPLPSLVRFFLVTGLVVLIVGIGWSRLALGAHYLNDVLGGYLLGFSFAALAVVASRLRSAANL